jgi:hypothetical protein
MRTASGEEAGSSGAERELERLAPLAAHVQAPPFLMNRNDDGRLEAAAEVRDTRASSDAGNRAGGAER